jgi:hypothetical protein
MRSWILASLVFGGALFAGCAPQVGSPCQTSINCSITGNRVCDTASTNGYCTVFGCDDGTCPAEGVCVRFRPMDSRLAFTACMRRCEADGNCRVDEGYSCLAAEDIVDETTGVTLAEVVDTGDFATSSFCVGTMPPEMP